MSSEASLAQIIDTLWNHPENAEWTPKVEVIPGDAFRQWMASEDIEVLGFVYSMLGDHRLGVEPELTLGEYLKFVRHYYERCFEENPDGEWSDSRYSAGGDLVNVLAFQWSSPDVPKSVMEEWKIWLAELYKSGSKEMRTCIVHATLEHLLEQGTFRKFFADWAKDPVLRHAYEEALLWYAGGGRTPLGKSPTVQPLVRSQLEKSRLAIKRSSCVAINKGRLRRPSSHELWPTTDSRRPTTNLCRTAPDAMPHRSSRSPSFS